MLEMEYKTRGYGGGAGGGSRSKKKTRGTKRRPAFNGVVALNGADYARFEECMTNPGEPTEATRQGAAVLRTLYK
jgi:hypothetical protein